MQLGEVRELWGVDVDADAIAWCRASLPGHYRVIGPAPPMPLATGFFDVVLASSVFTHLDEARQLGWIAELHRVLRPGGLLIASTHAPSLSAFRPDLSTKDRDELERRGFLFAPGGKPFSSNSTFHSRDYLVTTWGRLFGLERYLQYGLNRHQDLSAWRKW